jgi:hypothetical protein
MTYTKRKKLQREFEKTDLYIRYYTLIINVLKEFGTYVPSAKLERMLQVNGKSVRQLLNHARNKQIPIVSGPQGYFYATNKVDLEKGIRALVERRNTLTYTINSMKKSIKGV